VVNLIDLIIINTFKMGNNIRWDSEQILRMFPHVRSSILTLPYHRYLKNTQGHSEIEKVFILSREKRITLIHFWMYNKS